MMFYPESFKMTLPSDLEIAVERDFHAPRQLVFEAFTKPELVRRWLLGPDGWTMPVCEIDLRVGGAYRYVWQHESSGQRMGMGGVFREIVQPERIVATEKFDEAWYPGEALNTSLFEQRGEVTKVRLIVRYQSKEARDTASRSGMEHGMAAGYSRLERVMAESGPALISPPVIRRVPAQLAATIAMTVPRDQMRLVMGPGIGEIMSVIQAQGLKPAGPWFDHHFRFDPEVFDFEICVPVSQPVESAGRVVCRELPAVTVAETTYTGPYEKLGEAWGEFGRWMSAAGHAAAADFYQCYVAGPESSANPADWKTELRRPLME